MNNPAILWYPSDFISSTIFWNNEQCGAYIRLLNYQFTLGHLSLEQMKQITSDELVLSKFVKDKKGKYYNKRLEKEIEKRQNYCASRSKNKLGKKKKDMINISKSYDKTYDLHMGNENENININNNINNNLEYLIDYFNNNIHSIVYKEYEELTKWKEIFSEQMIIKAIDEAVLHNARNMKYINAILKNWKDKGYKLPSDIEEKEKEGKNWYSEDE